MVAYIPKFGDIIFFNLDPTLGHEQKGVRPALVVSNYKYNKVAKFFICCPITSQIKGYPFEVALGKTKKITGVVLSDQIRSFDLLARKPKFVEAANKNTLIEVMYKLRLILSAV